MRLKNAKGKRTATSHHPFACGFLFVQGASMTFNPFTTQHNRLMIGAHAASDLARVHQTPLYVIDEAMVRSAMRDVMRLTNTRRYPLTFVYASKAFLNLAMAQLVHEEGLSLDVVSGGELATAMRVQFPAERIVFHGNNKSKAELAMALDYGVGLIVLDNPYEVEIIRAVTPKRPVAVMVRVNPELTIDTHAYITTGHEDSKFGLSLDAPSTTDLLRDVANDPLFELKGLHVHLGSQLTDIGVFEQAIERLLARLRTLMDAEGIALSCLNLGGGFGVAYTRSDRAMDLNVALPRILDALDAGLARHRLTLEHVLFEPGRSLIANAGITLYEINALKQTPRGKRYVFVDGSMADHMRTALYQARYEAALVDRMNEPDSTSAFTIAGKACETGDVLIHEARLPEPEVGDILCVFSTGAYHYSMSSNYNRLPRPAVVFVNGEQVRLVNERESYDDVMAKDRL
jgi:diaminopimelate decarboxylase